MAILSSCLYSDFREKIKDKTALPGQIQMKIKKENFSFDPSSALHRGA
ncbi:MULTISPECIES: hypothetical protein [Trichococcus]|nr:MULTISPECIES: hypothetical protein [Trichococcus]